MIKKLNENKIYTFAKGLSMYTTNTTSDFPVNYYISHTFGKCPVHFFADDLFEKEIYVFLS